MFRTDSSHLHDSELLPCGTAVSVANYYTGWVTLRVIIHRSTSINAFSVPLLALTGLPERGTSSTSKLQERNFAN
ncbi:hypothetical protein TNCV_3901951 [Trichonephila clavipes]|nr:hypothetical protein TNCV_3901951 [Trichonephila clavipes]